MTLKKPFRICNKVSLAMEDRSHIVTTTLKALKDRYELRMWIPGVGKRKLSVVVSEGTLYVYKGSAAMANSLVLGCFLLPANVRQDKIHAVYRSYGLKIVMPMVPKDGIVIQVPVSREDIY